MSDPLDKIRKFLADNALSAELAHLTMELNRRKGIKCRSNHVSRGRNQSEETTCVRTRMIIEKKRRILDSIREEHRARKKSKSDN